jgi:hypothetical protein
MKTEEIIEVVRKFEVGSSQVVYDLVNEAIKLLLIAEKLKEEVQ